MYLSSWKMCLVFPILCCLCWTTPAQGNKRGKICRTVAIVPPPECFDSRWINSQWIISIHRYNLFRMKFARCSQLEIYGKALWEITILRANVGHAILRCFWGETKKLYLIGTSYCHINWYRHRWKTGSIWKKILKGLGQIWSSFPITVKSDPAVKSGACTL